MKFDVIKRDSCNYYSFWPLICLVNPIRKSKLSPIVPFLLVDVINH